VQLSFTAPAGTAELQVSSDPTFAGAEWQAYTSDMYYTLEADGAYTLYTRFRDAQGLVSQAYAQPITIDTQPPKGTVQFASHDPHRLLIAASDDLSGVAEIELQTAGGETNWMPYACEVEIAQTNTSVQVRFRDNAGNWSAPVIATRSYDVYLPLMVH
jgi:hypothetical protein